MRKIFLPTFFCFMIIASAMNLSAASLNRKGFVIGLGMGGGFTTYTTTKYEFQYFDYYPYWSERDVIGSDRSAAFATDFKVGYGLSDNLLLLYTNKVFWFSFKDPDWYEGKFTITGATMVSMSYFFKSTAPSFFASAGIGLSTWYTFMSTNDEETWFGLGLFTGIGYEMSPHWMIEFSGMFGFGGTDEDYDSGKNPISVMVTLHWLGY